MRESLNSTFTALLTAHLCDPVCIIRPCNSLCCVGLQSQCCKREVGRMFGDITFRQPHHSVLDFVTRKHPVVLCLPACNMSLRHQVLMHMQQVGRVPEGLEYEGLGPLLSARLVDLDLLWTRAEQIGEVCNGDDREVVASH